MYHVHPSHLWPDQLEVCVHLYHRQAAPAGGDGITFAGVRRLPGRQQVELNLENVPIDNQGKLVVQLSPGFCDPMLPEPSPDR